MAHYCTDVVRRLAGGFLPIFGRRAIDDTGSAIVNDTKILLARTSALLSERGIQMNLWGPHQVYDWVVSRFGIHRAMRRAMRATFADSSPTEKREFLKQLMQKEGMTRAVIERELGMPIDQWLD